MCSPFSWRIFKLPFNDGDMKQIVSCKGDNDINTGGTKHMLSTSPFSFYIGIAQWRRQQQWQQCHIVRNCTISSWENRQNLHIFNLWPVIYITPKKIAVQIQHRNCYLSKYTRHSTIIQNLHIFILWP